LGLISHQTWVISSFTHPLMCLVEALYFSLSIILDFCSKHIHIEIGYDCVIMFKIVFPQDNFQILWVFWYAYFIFVFVICMSSSLISVFLKMCHCKEGKEWLSIVGWEGGFIWVSCKHCCVHIRNINCPYCRVFCRWHGKFKVETIYVHIQHLHAKLCT
jgi:hypothetical protein